MAEGENPPPIRSHSYTDGKVSEIYMQRTAQLQKTKGLYLLYWHSIAVRPRVTQCAGCRVELESDCVPFNGRRSLCSQPPPRVSARQRLCCLLCCRYRTPMQQQDVVCAQLMFSVRSALQVVHTEPCDVGGLHTNTLQLRCAGRHPPGVLPGDGLLPAGRACRMIWHESELVRPEPSRADSRLGALPADAEDGQQRGSYAAAAAAADALLRSRGASSHMAGAAVCRPLSRVLCAHAGDPVAAVLGGPAERLCRVVSAPRGDAHPHHLLLLHQVSILTPTS